jgi:hypothetical protein
MAASDPEIILETYDKHQVKVPTSIAKRSNTINLMIEGNQAIVWYVVGEHAASAHKVVVNPQTPCL